MSARAENQRKTEQKILLKIKNRPHIMKTYFNSLNDKTANTKKVYINYVLNFLDYIESNYNIDIYNNDEIMSLKKSDIENYIQDIRFKDAERTKEMSSSILIARVAAISKLYEIFVDDGELAINPCSKIKIKKKKREKQITYLTKAEYRKVIDNIPEVEKNTIFYSRDKLLFNLGCTTGLRLSAISEIDLSDINLGENYIRVVEKGDVEKNVYFGDETKNILMQWISDRNMIHSKEKALFIIKNGTRMSPLQIQNLVKQLTYNINKNISPHKMRATCATTLYSKTKDIYLVQEILGHKSVETTMNYVRNNVENKKKAADILSSVF